MKLILAVFSLAFVLVSAKQSQPKVQVYSKSPGLYGTGNTLICHVSNFHPPDITISLLKNGVEIPGSYQTDLAFEKTWQFHLTKSVSFLPMEKDTYSCRVQHQSNVKQYSWEPDM